MSIATTTPPTAPKARRRMNPSGASAPARHLTRDDAIVLMGDRVDDLVGEWADGLHRAVLVSIRYGESDGEPLARVMVTPTVRGGGDATQIIDLPLAGWRSLPAAD